MNTTADKKTTSISTCKRCGYVVSQDEELCEKCKHQTESNPNLALW